MEQIRVALIGLAVAALVAIASVVAVVGRRAASYLDKLFDAKEKALVRADGIEAVLIAEERGRRIGAKGPEKFEIARQRLASLRPGIDPEQLDGAILAGVATVRASTVNASLLPPPLPVVIDDDSPLPESAQRVRPRP